MAQEYAGTLAIFFQRLRPPGHSSRGEEVERSRDRGWRLQPDGHIVAQEYAGTLAMFSGGFLTQGFRREVKRSKGREIAGGAYSLMAI